VYNDRPFSKVDIQRIQTIWSKGKVELDTIGRFGLGFGQDRSVDTCGPVLRPTACIICATCGAW